MTASILYLIGFAATATSPMDDGRLLDGVQHDGYPA